MTSSLRNRLQARYRRLFASVYEAGGAYGFRVDHGIRVMQSAEALLPKLHLRLPSWRRDALLIAALYADAGKIRAVNRRGELVYGSAGDRNHAAIGARLLPTLLRRMPVAKRTLAYAQQCIAEQQGRQQTLVESKVIKDLDRLDNYGVHQLWRHTAYAIHDRRGIERLWEFWHDENGSGSAREYLDAFHFPMIRRHAHRRLQALDRAHRDIHSEQHSTDLR